MAASSAGSAPAGCRPRGLRGSGLGRGAGPAAAPDDAWAGCPGWLGCEGVAGGIPAGRVARPAPDEPRWGFLSCERRFLRDICCVRAVEFSANVENRLTRPT